MLQLMLDAKEETGAAKIDNQDIQAQSVTFLLAGYETSSTTLGFVCYHLALDTHVQEKLRDEIDLMWTGDEVGNALASTNRLSDYSGTSNERRTIFFPSNSNIYGKRP